MKELKTKESLRVFELDENKKYLVYVEVGDADNMGITQHLGNVKEIFANIDISNIILTPMYNGKVIVNLEEVPSESTK